MLGSKCSAALACTLFLGTALAQEYAPVANWPTLPAGRETLGPMHGDVAVSAAGDVYVSVETEGAGVQVFTPDGRYLRSLSAAPADLHGFVIRDAGDGEHIYGVSLRGQKFVKMTLAGEIVLEISREAIPREYWTENRFSSELGVLLSGMDVAPNGDLYVVDGYSSDYVHRFDADGNYLDTFGGKAAPYEFDILHKIAMDTRFNPVRIVATDRLNNRVVHLGLDGEFLGIVNDDLLLPTAVAISGDRLIVGELQGRVTILDRQGDVVTHVGTNTEDGIGGNQMPPERWRAGYVVAAHGVAANDAGDLFVAEFSTFGRVHKFERTTQPRTVRSPATQSLTGVGDVPQLLVDPFWPKALPNDWILGQVAGVDVDADDHVWIVQRPGSLSDREIGASQNPPISKCCHAAPPVLEFDQSGNLLRAWGGPGAGYEWPRSEHGIHVVDGFVWLAGNGEGDGQVLKFTVDGEFVLQIGRADRGTGSNDTDDLGQPAEIFVDVEANEVYVADGYGNRRVIVFDADTGRYKRHWGAYGNRPHDDALPAYDPTQRPSDQFASPVHCIEISHEGLVYVCDRANNRYQVFEKDGTFVEEAFFDPGTLLSGSVSDLALSEDAAQRFIYIVDGTNNELGVVDRGSAVTLARVGRPGRYAGQFHVVHNIAIDSGGNLYTTEVNTGQRVQKFRRLDQ
jgi:DNA-binding beta-propeller fold protein YncE